MLERYWLGSMLGPQNLVWCGAGLGAGMAFGELFVSLGNTNDIVLSGFRPLGSASLGTSFWTGVVGLALWTLRPQTKGL